MAWIGNLPQVCEGVVVLESFTNFAHVADLVFTETVRKYTKIKLNTNQKRVKTRLDNISFLKG